MSNDPNNSGASPQYMSLTEVEVEGLAAKYSFADGHAYHGMPEDLAPIINDLTAIWEYGRTKSVPEMEEEFKRSIAGLIGSPSLAGHAHYSISPTASNSIDIAGAWLGMRGHNVGLLEPVFDNLYLLMSRRNVKIKSIEERDLLELDRLEAKIDNYHLKSLFIVTPNNPTGFQLSENEFGELCKLCERKDVSLVIDTTFRFYSKNGFDNYKTLTDSGVNYVVIEDTGKTWPTQDMKASLMVYSKPLANDLRMLYEEVFLCSSNFSLAVLSKLVDRTREVGLDKVVWQEVAKRTACVEAAIAGTPLNLVKNDKACALPVAWIDCSSTGLTDVELLQKLRPHNVVLLPGRFFYWNSQDQHTDHIRISLMKPDPIFYKGMDILSEAFPQIIGNARRPLSAVGKEIVSRPRGTDLA